MRPLKKKILLVAQAEGEEVGGFEWQKKRREEGGGRGGEEEELQKAAYQQVAAT